MILHNTSNSETLDDYGIKRLEGLDEVWYNYQTGSYEGWGQMIVRIGEQYSHHDLGHCSCYGPLDGLNFVGQSFEELKNQLLKNKEYYQNELKEIIEFVESFKVEKKVDFTNFLQKIKK